MLKKHFVALLLQINSYIVVYVQGEPCNARNSGIH